MTICKSVNVDPMNYVPPLFTLHNILHVYELLWFTATRINVAGIWRRLVRSWSKEKHEQHLMLALQTLREHKLYAKFSKCEFWLNSVAFLGHVVSKDGISVDMKQVEAI